MTFEELKGKFKTFVGDRNDDDTIQMIADFSEYETSLTGDSSEYITRAESETAVNDAVKAKDEEWRKRYCDTFFNKKPDDIKVNLENNQNISDKTEEEKKAEQIKIEDCFKEIKEE